MPTKFIMVINENADTVVAGRLTLENGKVSFVNEPDHYAAENALEDVHSLPDGGSVSLEQDPKLWFDTLESHYHGSYMWVQDKIETPKTTSTVP